MTLIRVYEAITPLHVGASEGNTQLDLPIERDVNHSLPKISGATVKGSYRRLAELDNAEDKDKYAIDTPSSEYVKQLFGVANKAGILGIGDLRCLLFPLLCANKITVYITSVEVLSQLYKRLVIDDEKNDQSIREGMNQEKREGKSIKEDIGRIIHLSEGCGADSVCFDSFPEYIYLAAYRYSTLAITDITFKSDFFKRFQEQLVVVKHENLKYFTNYNTEKSSRIRIDSIGTGTTVDNALFDVEYVPEGTIFYGPIHKFEQELFSKSSARREDRGVNVQKENETWNQWKKSTGKDTVLTVGGFTSLGKGNIVVVEEVDNEN